MVKVPPLQVPSKQGVQAVARTPFTMTFSTRKVKTLKRTYASGRIGGALSTRGAQITRGLARQQLVLSFVTGVAVDRSLGIGVGARNAY